MMWQTFPSGCPLTSQGVKAFHNNGPATVENKRTRGVGLKTQGGFSHLDTVATAFISSCTEVSYSDI